MKINPIQMTSPRLSAAPAKNNPNFNGIYGSKEYKSDHRDHTQNIDYYYTHKAYFPFADETDIEIGGERGLYYKEDHYSSPGYDSFYIRGLDVKDRLPYTKAEYESFTDKTKDEIKSILENNGQDDINKLLPKVVVCTKVEQKAKIKAEEKRAKAKEKKIDEFIDMYKKVKENDLNKEISDMREKLRSI